nr:GAF domain-containing protein [Sphingomonas quercus]
MQDIVARAAALFGVTTAALSIIDRHRQWFAARIGLGVCETNRAISFCGHAILTPERVLIVPDASRDRRFAGNPLVIGEFGLRFYAGAPLRTEAGDTLGALCVIGTRPQMPTPDQVEALTALSHEAAGIIAALARECPAT